MLIRLGGVVTFLGVAGADPWNFFQGGGEGRRKGRPVRMSKLTRQRKPCRGGGKSRPPGPPPHTCNVQGGGAPPAPPPRKNITIYYNIPHILPYITIHPIYYHILQYTPYITIYYHTRNREKKLSMLSPNPS